MKIGLQFAMPVEFHALPGAKELEPFETISSVPFYHLAPDVVACAGGVGKVNAAMAAEIMCRRQKVDLILSPGVAGCMGDLPTGSLVVASDFVQHDMDTSAIGDPVGFVSTVKQTEFPTWKPERCVEILKGFGVVATTGRVATGDWFGVGGKRAEWIRDTFHPLLLEMEGCAVAQVCLRNNVRFAALKSVSDRLFSENQVQEYFDFGQALKNLGAVVLPLALALTKETGD
ncbi:MAG: 5'-methylthioadenosine/S-adenosylhomocysteine nucleosidase [Oscillibacter sp.]|jgi:adenosylhomocysteine nucleosidase|nr:5'-methylthioadenosine/S-adenosylhomocysteine nucleosidase [Oscillibacter sp.]